MRTTSLPAFVAPALGATVLSILAPATLCAGGMALTMQSGAHLAHAYSAGASAEDASTVYFNPAGLVLLPGPQAIVASTYVVFDGRFTNTGSLTAGVIPTTGGNERDLGMDKPVPSIYAAFPLAPKFTAGLGISAPFGLGTSYSADWVGRYHALRSELETININPAIAWHATDRLSLGFGINWQSAEATLTNAVDFGLIGYVNGVPGMLPGALDGMLRIDGSDWSTGFNVGALLEVVDGTRLGLHYRSKMEHVLSGQAQFTGVPEPFAPIFTDQGARAALPLPEVVSLSLFHGLSPDLAIMADWSWWKWSRFQTLAVDFENPLTPDSVQPQNWKDASIFSVGLRWRSSSALTWRAGLAYNETPVPSPEFRTARIPDSDRIWVAAGLGWRITNAVHGDIGYAHLFMEDSTTTHDDGVGHVLIGDFSAHVDIVSLQLTWSF